MRFPTINTFLKWFGPSLVAFVGGSITLVAVLSQSFEGIKDWAELQFSVWWPIMSAGWFIITGIIVIFAYIAALVYTGGTPKREPGFILTPDEYEKPKKQKTWIDKVKELPPPPAPGTILDIMGKHSVGDGAKGNFNFGKNEGGQHYHESPKQREIGIDFLKIMESCENKDVIIRTKAMNADYEMQAFDRQIVALLTQSGFDAQSQGTFSGGEMTSGIIIQYSPVDVPENVVEALQNAFQSSGLHDVTAVQTVFDPENFILVMIGENG